jgi:hypothetical protein
LNGENDRIRWGTLHFSWENDGWCFSQWDGTFFHILRQARDGAWWEAFHEELC